MKNMLKKLYHYDCPSYCIKVIALKVISLMHIIDLK